MKNLYASIDVRFVHNAGALTFDVTGSRGHSGVIVSRWVSVSVYCLFITYRRIIEHRHWLWLIDSGLRGASYYWFRTTDTTVML